METAKKPLKKEVGKVRPMKARTKSSDRGNGNGEEDLKSPDVLLLNSRNMKKSFGEGDDISPLDPEGPPGALLINPIDPTKDFYTSTGRPLSPLQLPPPPEDDEFEEELGKEENKMDAKRGAEKHQVATAPSTGSERVKVIVRSRPMSDKELSEGNECVVQVNPERNDVEVRRHKSGVDHQEPKVFAFDAVYDGRSSQLDLYNTAFAPIVDSVLQGFNGTIFAYGQTGTGKTYTMEGIHEKESEQGVIPNAFRHIFHHVAENPNKQFLIRASYLEIYQEDIRDLLSKDRKQQRELRESPTSGVYVKDLSTYLCSNFSDINELMTRGNKNRSVGATNMNEHSSRSHAIFMITIEMSEKWADGRTHFKVGKLNLVDLAGSERQGKTGAVGERFKEATKINLSLSALGNVIAALVDGKSTHIPYRDSKLTRLLQDSLGGNSRTIMVATIGPSNYNLEETITTLRYASRAKKIKNKPRVNEDPKDALLRQYQEEIEKLRVELERKKSKQASMFRQSDSLERQSRKPRSQTASSNTSDDSLRQPDASRLKELAFMLEPYGLDPTTDPQTIMEKLAERRKELLQDNMTMKVEKDRLLQKLDETESLVRNTEEECSKLSERIGWLESKVLTGGKDLVDHTNEQQKLLEAKQQELAEQIERYEEMKKRLQEEELTIEELRANAEAFETELQSKTKKYKKLTHKFQTLKEETEKIHDNHTTTMRELETLLMELKKEFALKALIIDNFIPLSSRKLIEKRMRWDDSDQCFKLLPIDACNAIQRPPVDRSVNLPLFNISERGEVSTLKGVHFSNENILQLHPEVQQRKTRDYVPPSTDPYVSSLIKRAVDDSERNLVLDCSRRTSLSRTAKIPQPMDYFKIGENLLRRVKSARPPASDEIAYRDFAIVSPQGQKMDGAVKCTPSKSCTNAQCTRAIRSNFSTKGPVIVSLQDNYENYDT